MALQRVEERKQGHILASILKQNLSPYAKTPGFNSAQNQNVPTLQSSLKRVHGRFHCDSPHQAPNSELYNRSSSLTLEPDPISHPYRINSTEGNCGDELLVLKMKIVNCPTQKRTSTV